MAEITYLMGKDSGSNQFYTMAKGYFASTSTVVEAPAGGQTLEEVFADLTTKATAGTIFDTINLVSHASGYSSVQFGLTKATRGTITMAEDVTNALAQAKTATPVVKILGAPAVTNATKVRIYGCDVGKDPAFVRDFGLLFGNPGEVSAPVRVAVFRKRDGAFTHRLARTWTVAWPRDITTTAANKWPGVRTDFVAKAGPYFDRIYDKRANEPLPTTTITDKLTAAAASATANVDADAFFFSEIVIAPDNPPPITTAALPPNTTDVDDLTVSHKVTAADYSTKTPTTWTAWLATLGQVIADTPSLADPTHYTVVKIAPEKKASLGPTPVPVNGVPAPVPGPIADDAWTTTRDAFVTAGGDGQGLDDLVAALTPADDVALAELDAASPVDPGGEFALVAPS